LGGGVFLNVVSVGTGGCTAFSSRSRPAQKELVNDNKDGSILENVSIYACFCYGLERYDYLKPK
jgi:hypothetical protein